MFESLGERLQNAIKKIKGYGKITEEHACDLDRPAYERDDRRTFFPCSGLQKRRYDYHGLRDVLKRDAACHRHSVG